MTFFRRTWREWLAYRLGGPWLRFRGKELRRTDWYVKGWHPNFDWKCPRCGAEHWTAIWMLRREIDPMMCSCGWRGRLDVRRRKIVDPPS